MTTLKHETLWFRLAVAGLALAGVFVLVLSLRGRHRPPADDASLPSVVGPAQTTPTR